MSSSIVSMIQKSYCGWVSFGITPNLVQEICYFQTTLVQLFPSLIASTKETKMFKPAAATLPSVKTFQNGQKSQEIAQIQVLLGIY